MSGKAKIMQAALNEFANKRYAAASAQSIADAAGVTKGLIFHHFGSKKKLYLLTLKESLDRLQKAFSYPAPEGNLIEILITYTHRKLVFYLQNPEDYKLVYTAALLPPPGLEDEVAKLTQNMAGDLLHYFEKKASELPLKQGVDPKEFVVIVQALSETIQSQFTKRYGHLPDRGLSHIAEFEDDLPRYLDYVCYGMFDPLAAE